jgi:hypothetical protein
MAGTPAAITQSKLELRSKALEANKEELPQMEVTRQMVNTTLTEMKDLAARQASLTAAKQEVSKRLAERNNDAQKLLTFVDAGIRSHYGTRSEKLVEFGQQPFRSQPRVKLVLVAEKGQPVKPGGIPEEAPEPLVKA